ncbi:MAG TPA: glycoside hydrolase family 5 protein [Candidatus Binatia bacterium]|nr:glycoside hydrolase family 5 protein [Candidatus Binatia bacterium]
MLSRLFATFLLTSFSVSQVGSTSAVPSSRLAHLQRGVNLSAWFAQVYDPKGYTKEHFDSWVTPADIALIKSAGFDHVRLSANPQPLMDADNHGQGKQYWGYLDTAMKMILDSGLSVELDMHPESDFKQRLNENEFVERFTDFWRSVAKRYSVYDHERVFFEILNEPEMHDPYRWYGVEAKLAAAIRQAAPENTILAPGASWDNDDDLLFLEPLRDSNVIYIFHFYEPHIFTHQGATWGAFYWHWLQDLHYPSDPKNAAEVAAAVPDAAHRLDVIRYGQDHWNAVRIEAEINQVADWAKQNGVPVVCNEFGVYRRALPQDRNAWIRDTRTSLERHHIGWAMWDYADSFGVAIKKDGKAVFDQDTVQALGVKMP